MKKEINKKSEKDIISSPKLKENDNINNKQPLIKDKIHHEGNELDNEIFIIDEFYRCTKRIYKRVLVCGILFILLIPLWIMWIYQLIWAIKSFTSASFIKDKKLKELMTSWGILAIFLPIYPVYYIKSELESHIRQSNPENPLLYSDTRKHSKNGEAIAKKFTPHLHPSKVKEHYIICNKIDKSIKSLAFSSDILHSIDLFIDKGDIVVILGPSGSGKTTLLNIMAGVDKPSNGQVYIDGQCITDMNDKNITLFRKEEISYIYQRYGLIPILSVFDNIRIGQELVKKENRNVDLNDLIQTMGLTDLLDKFPHALSGGQKQRVSIARAIAKQPNVMFCDEPTGALDKENAEMTIDLFLKLNEKFKTTIIIVTHDNNLVKNANKIFHLRDGKIWKTDIVDKNKVISNKKSSSSKV
ncbi:MAG: ABC transporter ATP-binding protein [Malacoplasma sp.]